LFFYGEDREGRMFLRLDKITHTDTNISPSGSEKAQESKDGFFVAELLIASTDRSQALSCELKTALARDDFTDLTAAQPLRL
jgi:hypothetical protein